MLAAGHTFLLRKATHLFNHLWIILLDPEVSGRTLMVNLTSRKPQLNQDLTVILQVGEHPYLTQESIVNYGDARCVETHLVEQSFSIGLGVPNDPCSPELLRKIRDGLLSSELTPKEMVTYYTARATQDTTAG